MYLKSEKTKSCGCLNKQLSSSRSKLKKKDKEYVCLNNIYYYMYYGAIKRNIDIQITKEDLLDYIYKPCFYCNDVNSNTLKLKSHGEFKYNGIDRIDSNLSYTKDNIVTCCKTCNSMKNSLSKNDFINHLNKIINNLLTKNKS